MNVLFVWLWLLFLFGTLKFAQGCANATLMMNSTINNGSDEKDSIFLGNNNDYHQLNDMKPSAVGSSLSSAPSTSSPVLDVVACRCDLQHTCLDHSPAAVSTLVPFATIRFCLMLMPPSDKEEEMPTLGPIESLRFSNGEDLSRYLIRDYIKLTSSSHRSAESYRHFSGSSNQNGVVVVHVLLWQDESIWQVFRRSIRIWWTRTPLELEGTISIISNDFSLPSSKAASPSSSSIMTVPFQMRDIPLRGFRFLPFWQQLGEFEQVAIVSLMSMALFVILRVLVLPFLWKIAIQRCNNNKTEGDETSGPSTTSSAAHTDTTLAPALTGAVRSEPATLGERYGVPPSRKRLCRPRRSSASLSRVATKKPRSDLEEEEAKKEETKE